MRDGRRRGSRRSRPTAGTTTRCRRTGRRGGTPSPRSTTTRAAAYGGALRRVRARRSSGSCSAPSRPGVTRTGTACPPAGVEPVDPLRCTAFYSHPAAWNEIGFAGPAYPRGYKNLGVDRREPFEVPTRAPTTTRWREAATDDRRYETATSRRGCSPRDGGATTPRLREHMRRFDDTDEVDLVIVGCGRRRLDAAAAPRPGGLEGRRARRRPVLGSRSRTGSATRRARTSCTGRSRGRSAATDPVPLGSNNSGRGVGGSMVHYAGYTPRFHPSDFRTRERRRGRRGLADRLRRTCSRTTSDIESELPVAGEDWPWGDPHGYPHRPHPVGGNGEMLPPRGAAQAGITARVGPVAITNGRFGHRPHCIYRGFCLQGCKVNAKASPLITHVPDALAHGAEIRADCMVTRVEIDERTGRATGVHYVRGGRPAVPAGPDGRGRRLLDRDAAAAAELGIAAVPRRPLQRLRPGRPLPDGAGRAADRAAGSTPRCGCSRRRRPR